ncbi:MAG: FkbM family methyltransferase [Flavobacteriia bacterium]|nr:FkbM family methyltransferase [Flavobacteriia bacterium]
MLKNTKYNLYQLIGLLFPSFFKKRAFSNLQSKLQKGSISLPPEHELLILQYLINPKTTIIDIGANNGLYCYYFQEILKCKEIHAFEPIPSLFNKLNRWFKNIYLYKIAISDEKKITKLKIPYINSVKYETRAKLDDLIEEGENKCKEIVIQTNTLDNIFDNHNSKIGFIKIDIEGHELNAILGAKKLLLKHAPILMIEIEKRHHSENFEKTINLICQIGYECYFFNLILKQLIPFSEYNVEIYQNNNSTNTYYINNFFFIPKNTISIDQLNTIIQNAI